jgi:hypothetical protein
MAVNSGVVSDTQVGSTAVSVCKYVGVEGALFMVN